MRRLILSALLIAMPGTANAYVALQETTAPTGMKYTARFRVGHGCGNAPTTALSIQIPAAILDAVPYQQGGWTLASVRSGNRVSIVTWKGGAIANGKTGDFNIAMTLPRQPGVLAFPAVQTCGTTETAWTQVPAKPGERLERPAPLLTLVAAGDVAPPAQAARPAGGLLVQDGWWRALPGSIPAGGYFTLRNNGRQAVALTGASSPACGSIMLHQTTSSGGMAGMKHVKSVDVPPGGSASFAPGGYHLMCMAPGPAMKPGGAVPVTLVFQSGAKLTVTFAVRNAAGR
jgi:copper(I)-binding protein